MDYFYRGEFAVCSSIYFYVIILLNKKNSFTFGINRY